MSVGSEETAAQAGQTRAPVFRRILLKLSGEALMGARDYGLDQPLPQQFLRYVGDLAHGDFGRSVATGRSVGQDLARYFPATLELCVVAMAIVFFFQVLVDGWLTRLADPVVRYAPGSFLGVRFPFAIPIEDFGFGFALVTAVIIAWEVAGRREQRE